MAPKSVSFRRHDHLVSVLFGDLLSHSYNITFSSCKNCVSCTCQVCIYCVSVWLCLVCVEGLQVYLCPCVQSTRALCVRVLVSYVFVYLHSVCSVHDTVYVSCARAFSAVLITPCAHAQQG